MLPCRGTSPDEWEITKHAYRDEDCCLLGLAFLVANYTALLNVWSTVSVSRNTDFKMFIISTNIDPLRQPFSNIQTSGAMPQWSLQLPTVQHF